MLLQYHFSNSQDGERNIALGSTDSGTGGRNIDLGRGGGSVDRDSTSGGSSSSGSDGGRADRANVCRARHNNCDDFKSCCRGQCSPREPVSLTCTPGELWYAMCRCPGDPPASNGGGRQVLFKNIYHQVQNKLIFSTTSHGTGAGSNLGEDHTTTCKRTASNDCLEFKRCCSTRCETRYTSRCSSDGRGRVLSAYCRCTTTITT